MWSRGKRRLLHYLHIPFIQWAKPRPPLSFTNLFYHIYPLTFFPCRYFPPKATDPLQSSPCSLGHYGASKQTSWTSFNIRWNIRYFGSVPTLNYIWHHWLVPEMLADCAITPGLCWYKVTECGVLCSNLYMNLENIRILEVRSIFTYPAESFLLNGFDNYWKKQVSLKYNTQNECKHIEAFDEGLFPNYFAL